MSNRRPNAERGASRDSPLVIQHLDAEELASQQSLRQKFSEFAKLPPEWVIIADESSRVFYQKDAGGVKFYDHPTLGPLHDGWQVNMLPHPATGNVEPLFFNRITKETMKADPRWLTTSLKAKREALKEHHRSDSQVQRDIMEKAHNVRQPMKDDRWDKFERAEISAEDISGHYDYVHAIDIGGEIGGCNGGVFVVRARSNKALYVEKRFPRGYDATAKHEIRMLRDIIHPSLTQYINGCISPTRLSVYMEFCDFGSLSELIGNYAMHRDEASQAGAEQIYVPEKFLWHCFVGLCDALAYLQTGCYFARDKITDPSSMAPEWTPILHRDIKSDNILVRQRLRSQNYPYVVLSDFGLACYDLPSGHPNEASDQRKRSRIGTPGWWAPELCVVPPAKMPVEYNTFPGPNRHNVKTDMFALGCIMYNLAECKPWGHIDTEKAAELGTQYWGAARCIHIPAKIIAMCYSQELRFSIDEATRIVVEERASPPKLIIDLLRRAKRAYPEEDGWRASEDSDYLPDWAMKLHEYHTLPGMTAEECVEAKMEIKRRKAMRL